MSPFMCPRAHVGNRPQRHRTPCPNRLTQAAFPPPAPPMAAFPPSPFEPIDPLFRLLRLTDFAYVRDVCLPIAATAAIGWRNVLRGSFLEVFIAATPTSDLSRMMNDFTSDVCLAAAFDIEPDADCIHAAAIASHYRAKLSKLGMHSTDTIFSLSSLHTLTPVVDTTKIQAGLEDISLLVLRASRLKTLYEAAPKVRNLMPTPQAPAATPAAPPAAPPPAREARHRRTAKSTSESDEESSASSPHTKKPKPSKPRHHGARSGARNNRGRGGGNGRGQEGHLSRPRTK